MRKFINILIIALVTLVMLCACQPTPKDNNKGGGETGSGSSSSNSKYPIVIMSLSEYKDAWNEIKPYGKSYYTNPPNSWTTELIDSVYREGKLNFASRRVLRISDNCIEVYDGSKYIYIHNLDGIEDAKAEGLKH